MHREGSEKGAELAPTRSSGIDLSPRLPFTAAASHDPGLPPERPPPTQLCAAPVPPGPHSLLPSCCPSSLLKTGDTRQLSKQKQHWYRSKPRALLDHRAGGGGGKTDISNSSGCCRVIPGFLLWDPFSEPWFTGLV